MGKDIYRYVAGALAVSSILLLDSSRNEPSSPVESNRLVFTQDLAEAKIQRLTQARAYAGKMVDSIMNPEIKAGMRRKLPMNSTSERRIVQGGISGSTFQEIWEVGSKNQVSEQIGISTVVKIYGNNILGEVEFRMPQPSVMRTKTESELRKQARAMLTVPQESLVAFSDPRNGSLLGLRGTISDDDGGGGVSVYVLRDKITVRFFPKINPLGKSA